MDYKIGKIKIIVLLFFSIAFFSQSCISRVDKVSMEGYLNGNPKSYIYINRFDGDSLTLVDSIKTNRKGYFKYKLQLESPCFFTIGLGKAQTPIILLVQPSEELTIKTANSDLSDYRVFGSNGSARIRELNLRLNSTKLQIDSLRNEYAINLNNPQIDSIRYRLDSIYDNVILSQRKYTYGFVKNNLFSPASILALFQAYDSDHPVLDYSKDRNIFRMIDSSLSLVYPSNSIVRAYHLKRLTLDTLYQRTHKREMMYKEEDVLPNVGYPLTTGENLYVNSIWSKYVLIDFDGDWCATCGDNNRYLSDLYKAFAPKGLVIIQVSLGANPDSLQSRALKDSLAWYHVAIQDYYKSRLLDTLKVSSIPSSYIADRWGVVKAVNLRGDKLKSKLEELFPKQH